MKKKLASLLLFSLSVSLFGCMNTPQEKPGIEVEKREKHEEDQALNIIFEDSDFETLPIKASVDLFAMDTVMQLSLYAKTQEQAKKALEAAAKELFRLDNELSTNITTSQLYQLNTTGSAHFDQAGKDLMKQSITYYQKTDGLFNIAIYPIVKAWGFTTNHYQVPDTKTINKLLPLSDFNLVKFDENTGEVTLTKEAMGIDFGGIAKGYASDRVLEIFKAHKISSGLLSLGGNVALLGEKPNGSPFVVGIQNPNDPQSYFAALSLKDISVITSGDYQRFFEDKGKTYHHIIDPRTGKPANNGLRSVTIVSKNGSLGDSYATTLFILGKDGAIDFWQKHKNEFDMVLVDKDNKVTITKPLAPFYEENDFGAPEIVG